MSTATFQKQNDWEVRGRSVQGESRKQLPAAPIQVQGKEELRRAGQAGRSQDTSGPSPAVFCLVGISRGSLADGSAIYWLCELESL